MKYAVFAVLLFAPLAVAGTYLAGDPTSTEIPNIQLRTTVDSVADKPKKAKSAPKRNSSRSASGGTSTVRVRGRRPDEGRRGTVTVPPPPPASRQTTDEDDRDPPTGGGAAPVPIAPPATAGPGSEPEPPDDETDEEGEGGNGSETGGSEENGDDGDD